MDDVYRCISCDMSFKTNKNLQQHLKCKRHIERMDNKITPTYPFVCDCGKRYCHRQSLYTHKMVCDVVVEPTTQPLTQPLQPQTQQPIQTQTITTIQELIERKMDEMKNTFEKERQEMKRVFEESMKEQINKILDKHAGSNNHSNNSTNDSNNTNNTIETQVNININAFGNENTEYLDDKAILDCIGRVYKSIPSLVEKIHFDPKHPENHNIKITNKKLPYASVMGNNKKWKTVDRKDAIDTMVNNSYNILDDKFKENKDKISESKQEHFRGFQSRFDREDKELMKEIRSEVDMMVLNGV